MIHDIYCFTRFSAFGATAALPLLGAALSRRQLSPPHPIQLLGIAAAFHVFAYVDNDLCDLELDRSQPLRSFYPLVRGAISPATARVVSLGALAAAFLLDERLRWQGAVVGPKQSPEERADPLITSSCECFAPTSITPQASGPWVIQTQRAASLLALAGACIAIYNRYGKRCAFPPLTDAVQGLGWAALIAYGAGGTLDRPIALLMLHEVLLILLVNGVHGPLRDLANDAANGARTTALWFGARTTPSGALQMPPRLLAYALLLQLGMALSLLATLRAAGATRPIAVQRMAATGLAGSLALTTALLGVAARSGAPAQVVGMLHLILILSAPIALVAPAMPGHARTTLLLAHAAPLLANGRTYAALGWLVTMQNAKRKTQNT
jgi:4-hydroxybenzoate polyprenyltransferase